MGTADVPGKVGIPQTVDVGRNWVSLSWTKPERAGGAPVTAYKVEAWILGEEARWQEVRSRWVLGKEGGRGGTYPDATFCALISDLKTAW